MTLFRWLLLVMVPPSWAQLLASSAPEKEAALGKQLALDFSRQNTPIESASVQQYLNHLGQMLATQMPVVRSPFTFSTVATDKCAMAHEPVAIPGGYVFVPSGLFLAARDESEFAGMLAHAMAHIALRHGLREVARSRLDNGATIPLIFGRGRWCSPLIPLKFQTAQRSYELEADALAIQTMARAGFDPRALVRYFGRFQIADREERVAAMLSAIEQLGRFDHAAGSPNEFTAAQQEVRDQVHRVSEPQ